MAGNRIRAFNHMHNISFCIANTDPEVLYKLILYRQFYYELYEFQLKFDGEQDELGFVFRCAATYQIDTIRTVSKSFTQFHLLLFFCKMHDLENS